MLQNYSVNNTLTKIEPQIVTVAPNKTKRTVLASAKQTRNIKFLHHDEYNDKATVNNSFCQQPLNSVLNISSLES